MESSCECGNESPGSTNAGKLSSDYTPGGLSNTAQLHRNADLTVRKCQCNI
jgi:hypothetical protein